MVPTRFAEQTYELKAPPNWDEATQGKCGSLPVWTSGGEYVSCWRPSWRERLALLIGCPVWLHLISGAHPPVSLKIAKTIFDSQPLSNPYATKSTPEAKS